MTPSIKQRIAREWLILLACIVIGFITTFCAFYLGRKTIWEHLASPSQKADQPESLVSEQVADSGYGPYIERHYAKPKSLGDLFNDLWRITDYYPRRYHKWDEQAVKLWLCVLSPYFVLLFVRSIIWSVNTLHRH